MSIFAIGDTHLSFGASKPMDIFQGWENHTEKIEKNWRAIVKPEDTVVIPGDISWALNLEDTVEDFRFLESLPGTKIILKGNHDYWWSTAKKTNEFFVANGFNTIKILFNNSYACGDFVICGTKGWFFDDLSEQGDKILNRECGRLRMSLDSAMKTGLPPIVFFHYPPLSYDRVVEPFMDILKEYKIENVFYAHLHGYSIGNAFTGERDGIKFSLVSADSLGFCPKLIKKQ